MKIEKCPVCNARAFLFNRPENRVSTADKIRAFQWIRTNVPGFLYCHTDPHPGEKNLIWHVIASNNRVSCRMVLGPLTLKDKP